MFRRDQSGPMDIDDTHPLGRAAQYALDNSDEPSRKRPHTDLSGPPVADPFATPSSQQRYRFGPNTPFLFHAPPLPPAPKFEPYDPNRWARTDFGFGTSTTAAAAVGVADVDMDGAPVTAGGTGSMPGSPARATVHVSTAQGTAKHPKEASDGNGDAAPAAEGDARPLAVGAVARVRRRRQKWAAARVDDYDDDDDEDEAGGDDQHKQHSSKAVGRRRGTAQRRTEHTYNLHMNAPAAPAVRHSEIPAILLGYVQFVFNASLVVGFLYVASQFILAVRRDVQERIEEYSVEILQEISQCTHAYLANRCEPSLRVPAMEGACSSWETCMNRDPKVVGRARVGAETFAGVINSFVDPISWKTMGFTLVTLTFLIILTNSALFNLRAKHQHQQQAYLLQQQQQQQVHHQQQQLQGPPGMMYGYHPMMGMAAPGGHVGLPGGVPGVGEQQQKQLQQGGEETEKKKSSAGWLKW